MKLFHWKSQGIDLLIMSDSEDAARTQLISDVNAWSWQNPERFAAVLKDLENNPYYVAEQNHTITIDSAQR